MTTDRAAGGLVAVCGAVAGVAAACTGAVVAEPVTPVCGAAAVAAGWEPAAAADEDGALAAVAIADVDGPACRLAAAVAGWDPESAVDGDGALSAVAVADVDEPACRLAAAVAGWDPESAVDGNGELADVAVADVDGPACRLVAAVAGWELAVAPVADRASADAGIAGVCKGEGRGISGAVVLLAPPSASFGSTACPVANEADPSGGVGKMAGADAVAPGLADAGFNGTAAADALEDESPGRMVAIAAPAAAEEEAAIGGANEVETG